MHIEFTPSPPRDTYRSRVYAAEAEVFESVGWGKSFTHPSEIYNFIHRIVTSNVFNAYLELLGEDFPFQDVWVTGPVGANQKSVMAFQWEQLDDPRFPFISFPNTDEFMYEMIALHELAHIITSRKYAFHGKEWAIRYIFLVKYWMGVDYSTELRDKLAKTGVFG